MKGKVIKSSIENGFCTYVVAQKHHGFNIYNLSFLGSYLVAPVSFILEYFKAKNSAAILTANILKREIEEILRILSMEKIPDALEISC
ncbi:MAG: hypothetical protein ACE5IW_12095 [bacterium]